MLSELIEPYICAREINIVHAIVHCYRNQQREYLYLFFRLFSFVHCYCLCEYNWNRMHFDRNWNLNHVCIRRSDARPKHIYIYIGRPNELVNFPFTIQQFVVVSLSLSSDYLFSGISYRVTLQHCAGKEAIYAIICSVYLHRLRTAAFVTFLTSHHIVPGFLCTIAQTHTQYILCCAVWLNDIRASIIKFAK